MIDHDEITAWLNANPKVARSWRAWCSGEDADRAARLKQRNALVQQLAGDPSTALSLSAKAERVARILGRYRQGAWQHERLATTCPHPPGSHHRLPWEIFALVDRPLSAERVRKILVAAQLDDQPDEP